MQDKEQVRGLRFGFIGVGQCGGNIANEFAKVGYKAIAINTAETDLNKLDTIPKHSKLLINVGVQGAGKNPEVGKNAFRERHEEVFQSIKQVFGKDVDVIFVCAGLGGGTGSGIAPYLAKGLAVLLEYTVNVIVTLPSDDESPKSKIAALSSFGELSQIKEIKNIFVIDNERNPFQDAISMKNKYSALNTNIVNKLDVFNIYSRYASNVSAFDEMDLLMLLKHHGTAAIFRMDIEDVADLRRVEYLPQLLTEVFRESCFANIDYTKALGCAILFSLPAGAGSALPQESVNKMKEELGTPFETYVGVYEQSEKSGKGDQGRSAFAYIMLTGLPDPVERLVSIQTEVKDLQPILSGMIEDREKGRFSGEGQSLMNQFMKPQDTPAPKNPTPKDFKDLLKDMF